MNIIKLPIYICIRCLIFDDFSAPNAEFYIAQIRIGWNALEFRDQKNDEIGGHGQALLELVPNIVRQSFTKNKYIGLFVRTLLNPILYIYYISVVFISGMLLAEVMVDFRPKVTVNFAFIFGSSKQGNARLASVASKSETAKYLKFN